jgi:hypothetical protein
VLPLDRVGWHSGVYGDTANLDENRVSIGIAVAGNRAVNKATDAAKATVKWLVEVLIPGLPGYRKVLPHRDVPLAATGCPGDDLAVWTRSLNTPSSIPAPVPPLTVFERLDALERRVGILEDRAV